MITLTHTQKKSQSSSSLFPLGVFSLFNVLGISMDLSEVINEGLVVRITDNCLHVSAQVSLGKNLPKGLSSVAAAINGNVWATAAQ